MAGNTKRITHIIRQTIKIKKAIRQTIQSKGCIFIYLIITSFGILFLVMKNYIGLCT
jgi:hypothetical protein